MYFQGLHPAYKDPRPAPAVWAAGLRSQPDAWRTQRNRSSSGKPVFTTRTQHLHFTNSSKTVGSPSDPNAHRHQSRRAIFAENNKDKDYVILYNKDSFGGEYPSYPDTTPVSSLSQHMERRSDSGRSQSLNENEDGPREPMNAEVRSAHAYYYSPPPSSFSSQRYRPSPQPQAEVFQQQQTPSREAIKKTNGERASEYDSSPLGYQRHIFTTKNIPSSQYELNRRVNPCDVTIGERTSGGEEDSVVGSRVVESSENANTRKKTRGSTADTTTTFPIQSDFASRPYTSWNSLRYSGKKRGDRGESPSPSPERGTPSPSSASLSASKSQREAQRNGNNTNEQHRQRYQNMYPQMSTDEEEDTSAGENVTETRFERLRSRAQARPTQNRLRPSFPSENDSRARGGISSSAGSTLGPFTSDTHPKRHTEMHTQPQKGMSAKEKRPTESDNEDDEGDEEVLGEKRSVKTRVDPHTGYRVVETTVVRKSQQVSEAIERVCRFCLTRRNRCKCRGRHNSSHRVGAHMSSDSYSQEGSDYRSNVIERGSDYTGTDTGKNHHRLQTAQRRRSPKRLFVTTVTKETTTITKETYLPGGDIDEVVDVSETVVTVEDEYLWPIKNSPTKLNDVPYEEERVATVRGAKKIGSEKQKDWERAQMKKAHRRSNVQSAATTGTSSSETNHEGSGYTSISPSPTRRRSHGKVKSAASPGSGFSLPQHQHEQQSSSLHRQRSPQKEESYDKNNKFDHHRSRAPRVLRVSRKTTMVTSASTTSRDASSSASDSFDESSTTQFVSPHSPERIQTRVRTAAATSARAAESEDTGDVSDDDDDEGKKITDRIEEEEIEPLLNSHEENLKSKKETDDQDAYPVFTHPWLREEEVADNYDYGVTEEANAEEQAPSRSPQSTRRREGNGGIGTRNNDALGEKPEYSDNKMGIEEEGGEEKRNQTHEMENFFSMRTKSEATSHIPSDRHVSPPPPPPPPSCQSLRNYKNVKAKVDSNSNTNALHWRSRSSSPSISSTSPRRLAPTLESRPPWVGVKTSRNLRSSTPSLIRGIGEVDKSTPPPHSSLAQSRSVTSPSPSRRRHPSFVGLPQKGRDNHEERTEKPDIPSRSERSMSPSSSRSPSLSRVELEIICERCLRRRQQSASEGTTTAGVITLSRTRGGLSIKSKGEEELCVSCSQQGNNEASEKNDNFTSHNEKEEIIKEGRVETIHPFESERRVEENTLNWVTSRQNNNNIRPSSTARHEGDFITPTKGRSTSAGTTSSSVTDNALTNSSAGHSTAQRGKRSDDSSSHSTPSSVKPENKRTFGKELPEKLKRDHQSMPSAEAKRRSSSPSITFIFEDDKGQNVKETKDKSEPTPQSEITSESIASAVGQKTSPRKNANGRQSTIPDNGADKIQPRWSSSTHVVRRIDFQDSTLGEELAAPRGNSPRMTMKKSPEVESHSLARASSSPQRTTAECVPSKSPQIASKSKAIAGDRVNLSGRVGMDSLQLEGESPNRDEEEELHFFAADPTYLAPTVASLAKCTPQGLAQHTTLAQSAFSFDDEHFILSAEKLRENNLRGNTDHQEKQQRYTGARSQSPHHLTNENNDNAHNITQYNNPQMGAKGISGSRRHSIDTNVSCESIGKASSTRTAASSSKSQLTSAGGSTFGRASRWGDASSYPQPTSIRQVVLVRDDVGKK